MKINAKSDLPAIASSRALNPLLRSDLLQRSKSQKPSRRRTKSPGCSSAGVRLKRDGAPSGRRSRPETPLLKWKFDDRGGIAKDAKESSPPEFDRKSRRKLRGRRKEVALVSARKLAAVLWRLRPPKVAAKAGRGGQRPKNDRLGFQCGASHIEVPCPSRGHQTCTSIRAYGYDGKEQVQSPCSVTGPRNGYLCKFEPSFQFSNSVMEGATKWDPICTKTSDDIPHIYDPSKHLDQQISAVSAISALKVELERAQARILELETERQSSKKKIEHFLRKLSEERAAWLSREHEKVRAIINDAKEDLNREKKNRQKLEIINYNLVNELADAKLSVKRYMQDYEEERKARELIGEVCDELAKEIGEDKAEVEALKRESMKLREEVEQERKMLQMAEVWREERVQMKLVDAKVMIEEKYSHMKTLVVELENFLNSRRAILGEEEMRKAESLRQTVSSLNIQEISEIHYEPPNPEDIFSVIEDANFSEANDRKIEVLNEETKQRHFDMYVDKNGEIEDESGWETVSHLEDQGSSYSPGGSEPSVNKLHRDSNVSGSGTEWEENACEVTPLTEISEITEVSKTHLKKASSAKRFWRSHQNNGENFKIVTLEGMNGRLSNGASISPDRGSARSGDLVGQWSSPEPGNPHISRGMKGCIEWPRGIQKGSLKAKLLEARMESQKIQLRQVLKQKI
ncbi:hypothetical protein NMG60_11002221 [Bertholletia excelsa]